jgi:hypothetical protein
VDEEIHHKKHKRTKNTKTQKHKKLSFFCVFCPFVFFVVNPVPLIAVFPSSTVKCGPTIAPCLYSLHVNTARIKNPALPCLNRGYRIYRIDSLPANTLIPPIPHSHSGSPGSNLRSSTAARQPIFVHQSEHSCL